VTAPPEENRHLLEKIPDFYERLKDSYDPKFYEQEVLGVYLSMSGGRVYSGFDRALHVKPIEPDPGRTLYWALDFNVDPMSSVIVQKLGGKFLAVDEIVLRHATTSQACEEFMQRFPKHRADIVVCGDASGNQRQTTGFSDYQMVKDYFQVHTTTTVKYKVPKSNPSVRDRVNLMNRTFLTAAGDIGLTVDPKCKELIKDFEQVSFKAETNEIDKTRDRLRTHASDALGYLIWQESKDEKDAGERDLRIV